MSYAIAIIGGGPAGTAAALQCSQLSPDLASRVVLLDAASFPRDKLCGGGIVMRAEELLASLGVRITVPSVQVRRLRFDHPELAVPSFASNHFRVVRRDQFDHALLEEVRRRGVRVEENARAVGFQRTARGVEIELADGRSVEAQLVIGADGAASRVRRCLLPPSRSRRFVALEILTPGFDRHAPDGDLAHFDFTPISRGVAGYAWHFPSLLDGHPTMNRGLTALHWPRGRSLAQTFGEALARRGIDVTRHTVSAASAPVFDPHRPHSAERVLLAGDAVGVEPFLGEGISAAIATGILAAHSAFEALERDAFTFVGHAERLRASRLGTWMRQSADLSRSTYPQPTAQPGSRCAYAMESKA